MKVVEIKDFERESKKREFKEKIDTKIQNGKEWFIRNKETIIVLAPVVVAVFGAVLNAVVSGVSVESIVFGALMGLSSTGLHQQFKAFIEGSNNDANEEKV